MDFGIVSVAAITAICYLIGSIVKKSKIDNKWIPEIVGVAGAIFGIIGFFVGIPDFPATEPITAAAVGIVSGGGATWANQIKKQTTSTTDTNIEA